MTHEFVGGVEIDLSWPSICQICEKHENDPVHQKGGVVKYHVNVYTTFERDVYVEAATAEEAEAKVKKMSEDEPFWYEDNWRLAPEGPPETFFVEESA